MFIIIILFVLPTPVGFTGNTGGIGVLFVGFGRKIDGFRFVVYLVVQQGSLKNIFCNHLKHGTFSTKIQGHLHLQGNVQVDNVRIPVQSSTKAIYFPRRTPMQGTFACYLG